MKEDGGMKSEVWIFDWEKRLIRLWSDVFDGHPIVSIPEIAADSGARQNKCPVAQAERTRPP
jgi:hypothetical protein